MTNGSALPPPRMRPALHRFGQVQTAVVTVDDFAHDVSAIAAMASALAPFPAAGNHYPGLRRVITPQDAAYRYIERLLEAAAPFIGGAYDVDGFDLIEASFSMVTCDPAQLSAVQRSPHFDSTEQHHFAVMHYLCDTPGTAFYRHRATGLETVTEASLARYLAHARIESVRSSPEYIVDSNEFYEQTGVVKGLCNRLVIYPGNLLHSGLIPPGLTLSDDPRTGRLTTNIFIRAS